MRRSGFVGFHCGQLMMLVFVSGLRRDVQNQLVAVDGKRRMSLCSVLWVEMDTKIDEVVHCGRKNQRRSERRLRRLTELLVESDHRRSIPLRKQLGAVERSKERCELPALVEERPARRESATARRPSAQERTRYLGYRRQRKESIDEEPGTRDLSKMMVSKDTGAVDRSRERGLPPANAARRLNCGVS